MKEKLFLWITILCIITFAVIPKVSYSGITSKPNQEAYPLGIALFHDSYVLFGMRASLSGINIRYKFPLSKRWSVIPALSQAWPKNWLVRYGLPKLYYEYPINLTNIDLDFHLSINKRSMRVSLLMIT